MKNDGGWKDNLSRIAEAHPTSPLADQHRRRSIKEVKTAQVMANTVNEEVSNVKRYTRLFKRV